MILYLGDERCELKASFYTLYLYEQEFNADMIQDMFGVVRIELAGSDDGESEKEELVFDYTATAWTCIMKAVWAMAKTADELFPRFDVWAKCISGVNMVDIANAVIPEIRKEFFRQGVTAFS